MSMPSIPNITPTISVTREESISLLLTSIAMSEMSLSHIISAEAEAMQSFVKGRDGGVSCTGIIQMNRTTASILEEIAKGQWLSLNKLDRILRLLESQLPYDDDVDLRLEEMEDE